MKDLKCPVCGKNCAGRTGVSSHLFKTKDLGHRKFVEQQNAMIDQAFISDISCETLAADPNCWTSATYICECWQKLPGYKERKFRMNSAHMQCEWRDGKRLLPVNFTNAGRSYAPGSSKRTISKEQGDQIAVLFASDLGIVQIAQQVGCNPKTVRTVFVKRFGDQPTEERGRKLNSQTAKRVAELSKIENSNPELADRIAEAFHGDEGIKTVNARLGGGSMAIRRIWLDRFGPEVYEVRRARLLHLQRERAAVSLKKARFTGSKNEILCHALLRESLLDFEVKHHDYGVVPRLELDVTIPLLQLAITWDGVGHRKPIYGETAFSRVCVNDRQREQTLVRKGWRHISVIDDGGYNPEFVRRIVNRIIAVLPTEWQGKLEIGMKSMENV